MAEKIQSLLNDEESMRQIQELAAMFGGQEQENGSPPSGNAPQSENGDASGGLAGAISIPAIMSLMDSFSGSDPGCDLILALKPLLSKERQQKADKAVKMLRLYNAYIKLKDSGMLNDLF